MNEEVTISGVIASDIPTTEQVPTKSSVKKLRIKRAAKQIPFSKKGAATSNAEEGEPHVTVNEPVIQPATAIAVEATESARAENQAVQKRPTYFESRASPGAKLAICEEDVVAEGAGKDGAVVSAIESGDAIAVESAEGAKVQGDVEAGKYDPVADLNSQEAEREAADKHAELQAAKEKETATIDVADATASDAVAVEK